SVLKMLNALKLLPSSIGFVRNSKTIDEFF
ncbi:MAG: hypothetical protein ACI9IA_001620, partial [Enterobacterales bacterium]